jgi:hypothetical protein
MTRQFDQRAQVFRRRDFFAASLPRQHKAAKLGSVHPGDQLGRQAAIRFDAVGGSSNQRAERARAVRSARRP